MPLVSASAGWYCSGLVQRLLAVGLIALAAPAAAFAQAGELDTTFGGDGKVTTNFVVSSAGAVDSDFARAVAIQADGKIVAAGGATSLRFGIVRYNSDGTRDTSFSGDGKAAVDFTRDADFANGVAIQADGKIVAAGRAAGRGGRFALVRSNADGTLDRTFGGDGKVTTNFTPSGDQAYAVVLTTGGKIVAIGGAGDGGANPAFALVRYNADGSRDRTFGGDGKVTTNFTSGFDAAFAAAKANGKIVAVGGAGGVGGHRFALARYNADGTLDDTFSDNGRARLNITAGDDFANGVDVQSDRKIVAAGTGGYGRFALARFNSDGTPDIGFGDNGKIVTDFTNNDDIAHGVAVQPDGEIVAAGSAGEGTGDSQFALARYGADGALDTVFGASGKVVTDFTSADDLANAVALQTDGRIVAAGFEDSLAKFAVARYLGS